MDLMTAFVPFARKASEKKRCFFPGMRCFPGPLRNGAGLFEAVKIIVFELLTDITGDH